MPKKVVVKGARVHNLKNVTVEIPRDKLVVFTGVSGSGKSSLAFDTIYAESHRRYVESLSSYARQFLGQMDKPDVDSIEGLSPAISIDQKTTSKNPRSTVGTITEIYDYLRLLYARVGIPHCPKCGIEIAPQETDQIVKKIIDFGQEILLQIFSPIISGRKGEHTAELDEARRNGFSKVRIDDQICSLDEKIELDKNKKHNIEILIDQIVIRNDDKTRSRIAQAIELSSRIADGLVIVKTKDKEILFSKNYACPEHNINLGKLEPRLFSFNNPFGACKKCSGLGFLMKIDPDLLITNKNFSIPEGAIKCAKWAMEGNKNLNKYLDNLSKKFNFSVNEPIKNLQPEILKIILYGEKQNGIIPNLEKRFNNSKVDWLKSEIESSFMKNVICDCCHGDKLSKSALSVTISGINIMEFCEKNVKEVLDFVSDIKFTGKNDLISAPIIKEIKERLGFLKRVGLEYLTLSRSSATLSGGESQRIRLATQIGSALTGVLYVLDEPSIGLHQRDNGKLINTLENLRDSGNTVIVVEHDEETIYAADYIVDFGPEAGVCGGKIVASGDIDEIKNNSESITGQYLSGKKQIPVPETRAKGNGKFLEIIGADKNNLKNINIKIPLGVFACVTGVSGSGKSTLVNEVIFKKLSSEIGRMKIPDQQNKSKTKILGIENLNKVINVDQSPIGRTPRSNPATYTGVFTDIRELFSQMPESLASGFTAGRFSFNAKGGRCETCHGDGIIKIEMNFLPDLYVTCEICKGKRYNHETLEVKFRNKNISDVLEMTTQEAYEFFKNVPRVSSKLKALNDVGLGYVKLGQPATTLSGGEAQRVKLAAELSRPSTGKTIYILDEPTTGLHIADVHKLITILRKFIDSGNTVLTIEHNLDFIKSADYIIDLGPEGGDEGGQVLACGTPEEICLAKNSNTGIYLSKKIH